MEENISMEEEQEKNNSEETLQKEGAQLKNVISDHQAEIIFGKLNSQLPP